MTYVREQTSAELAAHIRSLKKMAGWFDPLADRLWQEVEVLKAENDAARKDLQNLRSDNAQLIYALKQEQQSYLVLRAERDQLKAELATERQRRWDGNESAALERDEDVRKFRAEIAGLKTGYEAYERVNAELKAENERLERNRDMWKGQVDRQCETIEGLRKALKAAEDAMWHADGNMDGEAADARDALADLGQGEQS